MNIKGLWNEVSEFLGIADAQPSYTVIGSKSVVIEGYKTLLKMSNSEVSFSFNKKILAVCGSDLRLKKMSKGFAVVTGQIEKVECL